VYICPMKAIKLEFDGKLYYALTPEDYMGLKETWEYLIKGGLDNKVLHILGPHRCDNMWLYVQEESKTLQDLAYINEAYKEKVDKLEIKYNALEKDYHDLLEAHNERKSILNKILGR
jgi:hypothetical protein